VSRLEAWHAEATGPGDARRGPQRQQRRRQQEAEVRRAAVAVVDWAEDLDVEVSVLAGQLRVAPRTLRDWRQRDATAELRVVPWGRPTVRSDVATRQAVLGFLGEVGPGIGLTVVRGQFPELARAELRDLLGRYRQAWRQRHPIWTHVLGWSLPGAVWAIDFSAAPVPIDGVYPWLLAVRDLASGYQLLWWPLRQATGEATAEMLTELFILFGAPLVLKSDNGSAFGSEVVQGLLARWGVFSLFSPPGCPRYNGAIEAAIGALKVRTAWQALRAGHAGEWRWSDLEAAWRQANQTTRPRGWRGPTPEEAWQACEEIGSAQRERFAARVDQSRAAQPVPGGDRGTEELDLMQGRARDRKVLSQVLVALGYLTIGRRRILPPLSMLKTARIT
jgi:transposase InsO family protein